MTQVLITRPLEVSRQLAEKLAAEGLSSIVMPLYGFIARQPGAEFETMWKAPGIRQLAVFTSPRAVQFGLPHIPDEQLKDLEIVAIGPATRARLEGGGHRVHLQASAGFTSEDLLKMPELSSNPGRAVIFCAPGGREALEKGLTTLGWDVTMAMVYERIPLRPSNQQVETLADSGDLLSVWTSVSSLELAEKFLPGAVWDKILKAPVLVISARIQHYLQHKGAVDVELADGPGNPDLLSSILRLTGRQAS
jgi:uroporphyrinogen-III synthase